MVAREINVIKVPRNGPLPDKPISFPKLENLHLDMMENKRKLKKNLPLITLKQPAPKAAPKAAAYSTAVITGVAGAAAAATAAKSSGSKESAKTKETFEQEDAKDLEEDEPEEEEPVEKPKKKKTKKIEKEPEPPQEEEEDELLEDLGEDAETPENVEDADEGEAEEETPAAEEETPENAAEEDDPYAGMSPEERERNEKEEYIWRFKILKKKYKNRKEIADYNEHDDLFTMKQTYDRTLREIQLEDNCESYQMYLFGGFMLMEFVSNNWLGIDLTGFAAQQMKMQDKYDRMLIELGEKSYNRWGSNLPVEIRLIGFIIFQAGIFYLGKIIVEKGGGTMAEIFKMFTGTDPAAAANTEAVPLDPDAPKKKMRGPSVKVADLKKKADT